MSMRSAWGSGLIAIWLLVCGCGGSGLGEGDPDAADATPDVAVDAAPDAAVDAAPDVGVDAAPPVDILEQLAAVPGMTVTERTTPEPEYRYFELWMVQPVDHDDPAGATFSQYMTLMHRSTDAPMTLVTAGYWNYWLNYRTEPTVLFHTNQLVVEHRYFGQSQPVPTPWEYLTIAQAAADHHRVFEALKPIYGEAWVATGASKGGMTAVYYRRHYPDDVDGTVAYVAPLSLGAPDARYVGFLENVGTAACRSDLRQVQLEVLSQARRAAMLQQANQVAVTDGLTFARIGGIETAFEAVVIGLPFAFWQYSGIGHCSVVPGPSSTDTTLFNFVDDYAGLSWASDQDYESFSPYYYQARAELGYPDVATDWIDHLLVTSATNLEGGQLPVGAPEPVFDASVMVDVDTWVSTQGSELMFIYGEYDPWSTGTFGLGAATDSYFFTVAQGTHRADISSLPWAERTVAVDALSAWFGLSAKPVDVIWPTPSTWQRFARDPGIRRRSTP